MFDKLPLVLELILFLAVDNFMFFNLILPFFVLYSFISFSFFLFWFRYFFIFILALTSVFSLVPLILFIA
ncbi:hypothetical protein DW202_16010 [Coprobacillus sp. AM17-34]|uniref:Uncharacterized protein n=1 Tax=Faecalibacillus intestinalis TaxID=1982626 RepID=A0A2T3FVT2_9FIRM|nr:hypothetical protein C7U54_11335 [Faecalibacillus intestinalis]RHB01239.1 hypothetical protein DW906_12315 [Coprobacillus sp. AM42-12AC]RHH11289.1 hypothetical protein DW226_05020 [Coprobacillus sp. AM18-4LB-d2]RHO28946.1 hypothetical protein DW202_16010 [Coprobacillus sp. AM17-34]RHQ17203.1 hypothetical protein DWZ13_13055 [Coprobacillus sp. AF29-3BH]